MKSGLFAGTRCSPSDEGPCSTVLRNQVLRKELKSQNGPAALEQVFEVRYQRRLTARVRSPTLVVDDKWVASVEGAIGQVW